MRYMGGRRLHGCYYANRQSAIDAAYRLRWAALYHDARPPPVARQSNEALVYRGVTLWCENVPVMNTPRSRYALAERADYCDTALPRDKKRYTDKGITGMTFATNGA